MGASQYIGRVGGLAAALGLGAAALVIGCGVAAADTPGDASADSLGSAGSHAQAAPARRAKESATRARKAPPASATSAAATSAGREAVRSRAAAADPHDPAPAAAVAASASPRAAQAIPPLPTITPSVCSATSQACAYVLGASGVPIPNQEQTNVAMAWYLQPNSPGANFTTQVVQTAEGAYPITAIKNLPIDPSTQVGLTEVRESLEATLTVLPPGTPFSYFGYSQSSIISSLLQIYQQNGGCETSSPACPPPAPPKAGDWPIEGLDPDQFTFVTVGQEMNPNGGWYSRFADFTVPAPGLVLYGATPEEPWAGRTINYALEYDGFADFPRYPLNFLSSLNAALGIVLVHTQYLGAVASTSFTPQLYPDGYFPDVYGKIDPLLAAQGPAVACQDPSSICKRLPTTPGTEARQEYYFIPTPDLPLLTPLRFLPIFGGPLAALIQPALKVIVDLGYADWAHGFGTEADQPPANVLLEFGVFPQVNPMEVVGKLVAGVQQGITDFVAAWLPGGSVWREVAAIGTAIGNTVSSVVTGVSSTLTQILTQPANPPTLNEVFDTVQEVISQVTGRIALAASALYATLLPLADFTNALLISLPGYALNLFIDGVQQALSGDLINGIINAVGRPIAATSGFAAVILVFQLVVFLQGFAAAVTGCGGAAPVTGFCIISSS